MGAAHYELRFNLGHNTGTMPTATEEMTVSLGGLFSETFIRTGIIPVFEHHTFQIPVVVPSSARLIFDHLGGDNEGLIIDNVVLVRLNSAAAPEPTSLTLAIIGVAWFTVFLCLQRNKSCAIN